MSIGIAIEGLMNNNDISVKDVDTAISEYEIAAQEAELEMLEAENEMTELEAATEMLNIDLAILEGAKKFIEEVGICKNLVELVDPMGVLREYNIFPAVENLNDVPTKDENAQIAVEGIKEVLSKAWDAIKRFFKKIGNILKRFFGAIVNATKSKEKLIVALRKKLNDTNGSVDADKWKNKKVTAINKDFKDVDTSKVVEDITKNIGEIIKLCTGEITDAPEDEKEFVEKVVVAKTNAMINSDIMKSLLKTTVTIEANKVEKETVKEKLELSKAGELLIGKKEAELTVSKSSVSLNFSSSVNKRFEKRDASSIAPATDAITVAKVLLKVAELIAKDIYKLEQLKDMAEKSLKVVVNAEKYAMKFADKDDKKAKFTLKAAQITRDINRIYIKLVTSVVKTSNQIINTCIGFAKAVLSCIEEE